MDKVALDENNKKTDPKGDLLKQIEKDFGTYDKLKLLIAKTSKGVDGNGWASSPSSSSMYGSIPIT